MAAPTNVFEEIQLLKDQLFKENLALREEIDVRMFEEIVGSYRDRVRIDISAGRSKQDLGGRSHL